MFDAGSASGAGLISADPGYLDGFVAGAASRTSGIEAAIARVDAAVASWNRAPCDPRYRVPLQPFGPLIAELAREWTMTDGFVARVAEAFRRADAGGGDVRYATQAAVDHGLAATPANYNPIGSLSGGDATLWAALSGANRCYANGGRYTGNGFIVAPDGIRYPLVVPEVRGPDGKIYTADDGGPGDVISLDGADPGWTVTGTYTGAGNFFGPNTAMAAWSGALIAGTGGQLPNSTAANPADYSGLVLGDGRPQWFAHGAAPAHSVTPQGIIRPDPNPLPGYSSPTRGAYAVSAGSFVVNAGLGAAGAVQQAQSNGYLAYRLVTERNLDGRVRARLQMYAIADQGKARVILPMAVTADKHGNPLAQVINYRPHVEPTQPQAEPAPDGTYHIYSHTKEGTFLGIFDTGPEYVYQDK